MNKRESANSYSPSSLYTFNVELKKESVLCNYYLKYPLMIIASAKKRFFSQVYRKGGIV